MINFLLDFFTKIFKIGLVIGSPVLMIWALNFVFTLSIPITVGTWAGFFVITLMIVVVRLHNKYWNDNSRKQIQTHTNWIRCLYWRGGSPLGNPFTSRPITLTSADIQVESREDSINRYRKYIYGILESDSSEMHTIGKGLNEILSKLDKHGYVNLVCFCKPKDCHGDVIKQIVEDLYNDKEWHYRCLDSYPKNWQYNHGNMEWEIWKMHINLK